MIDMDEFILLSVKPLAYMFLKNLLAWKFDSRTSINKFISKLFLGLLCRKIGRAICQRQRWNLTRTDPSLNACASSFLTLSSSLALLSEIALAVPMSQLFFDVFWMFFSRTFFSQPPVLQTILPASLQTYDRYIGHKGWNSRTRDIYQGGTRRDRIRRGFCQELAPVKWTCHAVAPHFSCPYPGLRLLPYRAKSRINTLAANSLAIRTPKQVETLHRTLCMAQISSPQNAHIDFVE